MRRFFFLSSVFALLATAGLGWSRTRGPVKVGVVLPTSGTFALYGEPIRKGIDLAYEEIQQEGTLDLVLDIRDSGGDADRAAELLRELYDDHAVAAIGGVLTDEALKMVPVVDSEDKVLLSPSASSPLLTGISRNFFRIYPSDFLEGNKMGIFAATDLSINQMVILAAESPYAKGIQDVFKREYEKHGGNVLEVIEYPAGGTDFSGLVDRALQLKPVGIYVADYAQNVSEIISALRAKNFDGKILTTSAYAAPDVIAQAGKDAERVLLTQTAVPPEDPALVAFEKAYEAKYNEKPNIWAAQGYDSLKVLATAIINSGSLPDEVWGGLRGLRNYHGASGVIQFDEKGDVGKFPRTYVVDDGELVDYEQARNEQRAAIQRRIEELNRRRMQRDGNDG
jgi:branched-chain amino acid transport system substrate-binding protein